jgi:hypothetical protein
MRTLSISIVTNLIEYLGEFEFIFETILDYGQGTRWVLLKQTIRHRKSHAWAPLKDIWSASFRGHGYLLLRTKLFSNF